MTITKTILALSMAVSISACATSQTATRDVGFDTPRRITDQPIIKTFALPDATEQTAQDAAMALTDDSAPDEAIVVEPALPSVRVEQISVVVPKTLLVSERNNYLPAADIVWREDPIGDRHAQVRAIFDQSFAEGTEALEGDTPVSLYVQVMRFHALTEKARYTVGGVHSIKFGLAVRDLNSGQLLGDPRIVEADLDAFGGGQALQAQQNGLTQKVRISQHLAEVIRQELTEPGGFKNPHLGIIQAMNRF